MLSWPVLSVMFQEKESKERAFKRRRLGCRDDGESASPWTASFHQVVDIVLKHDLLVWYDGMALGATSKTCRDIWKSHHEERYLKPLVHLLDRRNSTNIDTNECPPECECYAPPLFADIDPRRSFGYNDWSCLQKARSLTAYTARLVANLHSFYDPKFVTNPTFPENHRFLQYDQWYGIFLDGDLGVALQTMMEYLPRRYLLARNIATLLVAQKELECEYGPPNHFDETFCGLAALLPEHDCFPKFMAYQDLLVDYGNIGELLPARDQDFASFLQNRCYPSAQDANLLGPVLTRKVSIFGPFFDMCPLKNGDNDEPVAINFPEELHLEPMHVTKALKERLLKRFEFHGDV